MLEEPFVVIDEEKMKANLSRMHSKSKASSAVFSPHLKTHQSCELIPYYRELGIEEFTVSSIEMAKYFADAGVQNITVAFPADIRQISTINELTQKTNFSIFIDNLESAQFLSKNITGNLKLWLEINNGYNRSGIDINDKIKLFRIVEFIINSNNLELVGMSAHDGLNYSAKSSLHISVIHNHSKHNLLIMKQFIESKYSIKLLLSLGDTPAMSLMDDFSGIDVIRPGAFIFYDLQQWSLGACTLDDIAAYLAAPVISRYEKEDELLLRAGAIHLSKDNVTIYGNTSYGMLAILDNDYRIQKILTDTHIRQLTQEHAMAKANSQFSDIRIGDLIGVIPAHTCLMCACARRFYCNGKVLSKM